jgi:hypothetical protein
MTYMPYTSLPETEKQQNVCDKYDHVLSSVNFIGHLLSLIYRATKAVLNISVTTLPVVCLSVFTSSIIFCSYSGHSHKIKGEVRKRNVIPNNPFCCEFSS